MGRRPKPHAGTPDIVEDNRALLGAVASIYPAASARTTITVRITTKQRTAMDRIAAAAPDIGISDIVTRGIDLALAEINQLAGSTTGRQP